MKIPDGWVLVPKEPTEAMRQAGVEQMPVVWRPRGERGEVVMPSDADFIGPDGAYKAMLAAAPPPPVDEEVQAGMAAPGLPGALYRLINRCDYREVDGWLRAEIIRSTEEIFIFGAIEAAVSSMVLQVAGRRTRSIIRETARGMMTAAANLLEADIKIIIDDKKSETVLHNKIRLVRPQG